MDKSCKYSRTCGHEYCNSTDCTDYEKKPRRSAEALWHEYFGEIEAEEIKKQKEAEERKEGW